MYTHKRVCVYSHTHRILRSILRVGKLQFTIHLNVYSRDKIYQLYQLFSLNK